MADGSEGDQREQSLENLGLVTPIESLSSSSQGVGTAWGWGTEQGMEGKLSSLTALSGINMFFSGLGTLQGWKG